MDGPRRLPSGRLGDSATGAGGFDTHYPEYFPARRGFADATRRLQVRTTALTGIIIYGRAKMHATMSCGISCLLRHPAAWDYRAV